MILNTIKSFKLQLYFTDSTQLYFAYSFPHQNQIVLKYTEVPFLKINAGIIKYTAIFFAGLSHCVIFFTNRKIDTYLFYRLWLILVYKNNIMIQSKFNSANSILNELKYHCLNMSLKL